MECIICSDWLIRSAEVLDYEKVDSIGFCSGFCIGFVDVNLCIFNIDVFIQRIII